MQLQVGTAMTGVFSQPTAQRVDLGGCAVIPAAVSRYLRQLPAGQLVAYGRGQVPPGSSGSWAERRRDPDPLDGADWHRKVSHRQPFDLVARGQHERERPAVP